MGVILRKMLRDLWNHKLRTFQIVSIIGVGALAVGMIISTRDYVINGMHGLWLDSSPAMIGMYLTQPISDDMLRSLARIDGVIQVEGFAAESVEWQMVGTDHPEEWTAGTIIARSDYSDQELVQIDLEKGDWPTSDSIGIGQGSDTAFGITVGSEIVIKTDNRETDWQVTGQLYDPIAQPPSFGGVPELFVTRETFDHLFGSVDYNRLFVTADVEVNPFDEAGATEVADRIKAKLEKQGIGSGGIMPPAGNRVVDPNKHFFQDIMDGIFLILGIMAVLSLGLGLFLVYNSMNAIILNEVNQIGIMKSIGAGPIKIFFVYIGYAIIYGLLALILSVPVGILLGWQLNRVILAGFNATPEQFEIVWLAVTIQLLIGLLAPVLASLIPVYGGARTTVNDAINSYGLSAKVTWLEKTLNQFKQASRMLLLMISNTFRHKGRVALTQITLVLSGLIFMMVMGVGDSINYTFGTQLFSILNSNISLMLSHNERIESVERLAHQLPEVDQAEVWMLNEVNARPINAAESEDDPTVLTFAVPSDTQLYIPQMRAGRWLEAQSDHRMHEIVINQGLADELGVGIGDQIILDPGPETEQRWVVVGILFDPLTVYTVYVPRSTMAWDLAEVDRGNTLWVKLGETHQSPADELRVEQDLRQLYRENGIELEARGVLAGQSTSGEVIRAINNQFSTIVFLLSIMAIMIGVVGSIALSGILSLNVLERQRETGVMRAIGAMSKDISRLYIGEGLILGWLSWLIAMPLSIPAGRWMTLALTSALGIEITFHFTWRGPLYWLVIMTVLAILASWLPARRANRVSVRESLAYA